MHKYDPNGLILETTVATSDQIKALVESHGEADEARFRAVTMQIAARSAMQGHDKLANELRAILDRSVRKRTVHIGPAKVVAITPRVKDLEGLVIASHPAVRLRDMVLSEHLEGELRRVVTEYRQRDRLRSHGLSPKRRLLLVGPPGCGKTMTASALAGECGLPLMSVQLHGLISRFMGETAAKLFSVFEAMKDLPGVYLFDEFDAIGSIRGTKGDVGEIKRVLNSFLQFLEESDSDSMVVAATNLIGVLDQALFRRFDVILRYGLPSSSAVRPLIQNRLASFDTARIDWRSVERAADTLCHADIVAAAEQSAKDAVLAERKNIRTQELVGALNERHHTAVMPVCERTAEHE